MFHELNEWNSSKIQQQKKSGSEFQNVRARKEVRYCVTQLSTHRKKRSLPEIKDSLEKVTPSIAKVSCFSV